MLELAAWSQALENGYSIATSTFGKSQHLLAKPHDCWQAAAPNSRHWPIPESPTCTWLDLASSSTICSRCHPAMHIEFHQYCHVVLVGFQGSSISLSLSLYYRSVWMANIPQLFHWSAWRTFWSAKITDCDILRCQPTRSSDSIVFARDKLHWQTPCQPSENQIPSHKNRIFSIPPTSPL